MTTLLTIAGREAPLGQLWRPEMSLSGAREGRQAATYSLAVDREQLLSALAGEYERYAAGREGGRRADGRPHRRPPPCRLPAARCAARPAGSPGRGGARAGAGVLAAVLPRLTGPPRRAAHRTHGGRGRGARGRRRLPGFHLTDRSGCGVRSSRRRTGSGFPPRTPARGPAPRRTPRSGTRPRCRTAGPAGGRWRGRAWPRPGGWRRSGRRTR